jgi:hypothetical protein
MRRALTLSLSSLLIASPALGGVNDLLLRAPAVTLVGGLSPQNGNFSGPTPTQQLVFISGSRQGTFSPAPAVGDCLVAAYSQSANAPSYPALTSGWTLLGQNNGGSAGATRGAAWHQVGIGEGASFTPFADTPGTSCCSTGIVDVGPLAGGCSGHFALVDGWANSQGPSTTGDNTTADNTLELAFWWQESSGGVTYSNPTATGNAITNPVYSALSGPPMVSSYGEFRYSGAAVSLVVSGHWTGGAGFSTTGGMLVRVTP